MNWFEPSLICACLCVSACGPRGGTDVGNGATVRVNMVGYETKPAASQKALVLESGDTVDSFWIVTGRIRMRAGANCEGGENEVDVEGPFAADLIGQGVFGAEPEFDRDPGTYCRMRLEFRPETRLPSGLPDDLAGLSTLVKGKTLDGRSFLIRSKQKNELRLDAKNGTFSIGNGDNPLLVAFDLGTIMASVRFSTLAGDPIVIDDENNKDALKSFEDAMKTASRLFRDEDDDGALSDDEQATDKELAKGDGS
jgi:hypothetical protein